MPVAAILVPMAPNEPVQTLALGASGGGSKALREEVLSMIGESPFAPLFSAPLGDKAVVYWISSLQDGINERIARFASISDIRGDAAVVFEGSPAPSECVLAFSSRIERPLGRRTRVYPPITAAPQAAPEGAPSTLEKQAPLPVLVSGSEAAPISGSFQQPPLETAVRDSPGLATESAGCACAAHFQLMQRRRLPSASAPSYGSAKPGPPQEASSAASCTDMQSSHCKLTHSREGEGDEVGAFLSPRKRQELDCSPLHGTLGTAGSALPPAGSLGTPAAQGGAPMEVGSASCREEGEEGERERCADVLPLDSLAHIFSSLSFKDLFACVRVNPRWRHAILEDQDLLERMPILRSTKLPSAADFKLLGANSSSSSSSISSISSSAAAAAQLRWMHPALRIKMGFHHIPALLVQAAEAGNTQAMAWYADSLEGQGGTGGARKALEWRKKAARKGHQACQYLVGMALYRGDRDCMRDVEEALVWLLRCVKNPESSPRVCAAASLLLGYMYLDGEGTERADISEAIKWLKLARDLGCREAEETVGWLWNTGQY